MPLRPLRSFDRAAHLWRCATGLSNYGWIVLGLPKRELLAYHVAIWTLCRAVLTTAPTQTDLTTLGPSPRAVRHLRINAESDVLKERVEWLIWLARLLIPGAQCLPTAIATWWLLGDGNAYVQIGVRCSHGEPFAHAWVVHQGAPMHCDSFGASHVFLPTWRSQLR
jgi:hypothetical protein